MYWKQSESIRRYRELTKGKEGGELRDAIRSFRCGEHTQDLFPFEDVCSPVKNELSNDINEKLYQRLHRHLNRKPTEEDIMNCSLVEWPKIKNEIASVLVVPDIVKHFYYNTTLLGELAMKGNMIIFISTEGNK